MELLELGNETLSQTSKNKRGKRNSGQSLIPVDPALGRGWLEVQEFQVSWFQGVIHGHLTLVLQGLK